MLTVTGRRLVVSDHSVHSMKQLLIELARFLVSALHAPDNRDSSTINQSCGDIGKKREKPPDDERTDHDAIHISFNTIDTFGGC